MGGWNPMRIAIARLADRRISLGLGLVSVLGLALSGCSGMRNARREEAPRLGRAEGLGSDPYLASHRPQGPTGGGGSALARSGPSADGPRPTSVRSTVHPVASGSSAEPGATLDVTLAPPISVPVTTGARPAPAPAPVDPLAEARAIVGESRKRVDALANYQVRANRQERVGDALLPAEEVVIAIRRSPRAVRIEWPEGPHKGREVIYSATDPTGRLHVHSGPSLIPIPDLAFATDSPLVMRTSRHPITEAGFETILTSLEESFAPGRAAGSGAGYRGVETPPEYGRPCHVLTRKTPGESWVVSIDAETKFPAIVEAKTPKGELLERYIFRSVLPDLPELLAANAFDPATRWGSSPGLLGRIARSGGEGAKSAATTPPR